MFIQLLWGPNIYYIAASPGCVRLAGTCVGRFREKGLHKSHRAANPRRLKLEFRAQGLRAFGGSSVSSMLALVHKNCSVNRMPK